MVHVKIDRNSLGFDLAIWVTYVNLYSFYSCGHETRRIFWVNSSVTHNSNPRIIVGRCCWSKTEALRGDAEESGGDPARENTVKLLLYDTLDWQVFERAQAGTIRRMERTRSTIDIEISQSSKVDFSLTTDARKPANQFRLSLSHCHCLQRVYTSKVANWFFPSTGVRHVLTFHSWSIHIAIRHHLCLSAKHQTWNTNKRINTVNDVYSLFSNSWRRYIQPSCLNI